MTFQRSVKRCRAAVAALFCTAQLMAQDSVHWALRPVIKPEVSVLQSSAENPIDSFIRAGLRQKNLFPSPEADRRTLIRRLFITLTGLPPSIDEVRAFENDSNPTAYAQLVDRLLASPHYGERWARHWLDAVRFAETHGFEMNQPRANAWPYRDYVIAAFNSDKPYDQFILEQIAGDLFGADEATGFLVAGPWDQVKSPDPVLTANQRADELHDIISTTSSTFLGLTVGCARCHDHKFDPIPQNDYYALKAVFEGVQHGERKLRTKDAPDKERQLAESRTRITEIETMLDNGEPVAGDAGIKRVPVNPRRNIERFAPVHAQRLRFTIAKTTELEPCIDELEVYAADGSNVALAAAGTKAAASSVYPNSEIHRLEHINDGRHGNGRSWISNEPGVGWVELEFNQPVTITKVIWGRDREQRFADRLPAEYRIEVWSRENWELIASSADRQAYDAKAKQRELWTISENGARRALLNDLKRHEELVVSLSKAPSIYAGALKDNPGQTFRFHRGDPMQLREEVRPGAVSVISGGFQPATECNGVELTEDQRRRLALARWIANPQNPLTARVMVNRIWQHHFGEGLVSTPSDFGLNGAKPSHPKLLDWLATELMEHGWSIKHVQRLIVHSAAYRQSSELNSAAFSTDAATRLLWRFPPRRVEAEVIRDSILQVSGKLDLRMGGPGFSFFEPNENYVRVYAPRQDWPADTDRRMIYATVVRQRVDGVFGAFDCPDAGQIAPKRTSSITPLQALNLLNSSFILTQSRHFAERLERDAGSQPDAQVERAFELIFQRRADADEESAAIQLVRQQGLLVFCRALFNANEFVYLF